MHRLPIASRLAMVLCALGYVSALAQAGIGLLAWFGLISPDVLAAATFAGLTIAALLFVGLVVAALWKGGLRRSRRLRPPAPDFHGHPFGR